MYSIEYLENLQRTNTLLMLEKQRASAWETLSKKEKQIIGRTVSLPFNTKLG